MGWSPTLTWLRWGPKYQLHRRILQPPFTKSKVGQYRGVQRKEALTCCRAMIENPATWVTAVRQFSVSIVLNISYGLSVDGPSSPWIKLAENSANAIGKSGAPASSIMDRFPASTSPVLITYMRACTGSNILDINSSPSSGLAAIHGEASLCPQMALGNRVHHSATI